jgi:hypothetical protein
MVILIYILKYKQYKDELNKKNLLQKINYQINIFDKKTKKKYIYI